MTSQKKIEANRRNAKLSTGPKTARGKVASRRNAIKHGLASVALRTVERSVDKDLLDALAPPGSSEEQRELALRVAESALMLDYAHLCRSRQARAFEYEDLSNGGLKHGSKGIERYEERAQARLRKAAKRLLERC